jgi:hypothetical protein
MTGEPGQARLCRCDHPLLDDDTCLRCGRALVVTAPPPSQAPEPRQIEWTRPGVVRALRAFAFFRGRPARSADWQKRLPDDWPQLETVATLFGSLDAANRAAGVYPNQARARSA